MHDFHVCCHTGELSIPYLLILIIIICKLSLSVFSWLLLVLRHSHNLSSDHDCSCRLGDACSRPKRTSKVGWAQHNKNTTMGKCFGIIISPIKFLYQNLDLLKFVKYQILGLDRQICYVYRITFSRKYVLLWKNNYFDLTFVYLRFQWLYRFEVKKNGFNWIQKKNVPIYWTDKSVLC